MYNTLVFDKSLCVGCRMCVSVCPHAIFEVIGLKAVCINKDRCMECGACQVNCPSGAIKVQSGVGCAKAMIIAAIKGKNSLTPHC